MGNRSFLNSGIIGIVLIISSLLLTTIFPQELPSAPTEYGAPIIAFEFVKSQSEVEELFKTDYLEEKRIILAQMDLGNKVDFGFAFVYSAFLALICFTIFKLKEDPWFIIGLILACIACVADILENIQLLEITSKLDVVDFEQNIIYLQLFTWVKWMSIALVFIVQTKFLIQQGIYPKFISVFAVLTLVLGIFAFFIPGKITGLFAISVSLMFFLLFVFCFSFKNSLKLGEE